MRPISRGQRAFQAQIPRVSQGQMASRRRLVPCRRSVACLHLDTPRYVTTTDKIGQVIEDAAQEALPEALQEADMRLIRG